MGIVGFVLEDALIDFLGLAKVAAGVGLPRARDSAMLYMEGLGGKVLECSLPDAGRGAAGSIMDGPESRVERRPL
jgi:hypothetical protein